MTQLGLHAFLSNQMGTQLGARARAILSYVLTSFVCHRYAVSGTMLAYHPAPILICLMHEMLEDHSCI